MMKLKLFGTLAAMVCSVVLFGQGTMTEEQKAADEAFRQRAVNRVENMCQTVSLNKADKELAIQYNYEYFRTYAELKARNASDAELQENADLLRDRFKTLIPSDQREAYTAWRKQPIEVRDRAVEPRKPKVKKEKKK